MNERGYDEIDPGLEDRARSLLTAAAETVPVSAGPMPGAARRPVWPWLAAAAAVAVLLVGVPVLLEDPPDRAPAPAPAPGSEVTVPQTLWMTTGQATEILASKGLEVETVREQTCEVLSGRVMATRPAPGVVVAPGSAIRVRVSYTASAAFCEYPHHMQDALGLFDLARFGETGLEFAPEVDVYLDGELTRTLIEAASDPESWGSPSPLTRLVDAVEGFERRGDEVVSPTLTYRTDRGGQLGCGPNDPPAPLDDRPSTVISVEVPVDGIFGCQWVRVYRDESGRIDAVASVVGTRAPAEEESPPASPAEPTAEQRAVAEAFAAYARGGEPPAFAPEVDILLGNRVFASASDVEAGPRAMWAVRCAPGYAERSCPIDVLEVVAGTRSLAITSTVARERSMCHTAFGELPADLTTAEAFQRSVSLSVPEPGSCMNNWELQLWLDDEDRIYAANLILGSP